MSGVPDSSHGGGGLPTTGGTLTGPLVIGDANNNDVPEQINLSLAGINVNMFAIHDTDGGGADLVYVDSGGTLHVYGAGGFGADLSPTQLAINDGTGGVFVASRSSGVLVSTGKLVISGVPTSDPGVPGQVYSVAGVLHISP